MARRAKKDKSFVIKCSHCLENDFKLDDVNADDKIKFYTDTPLKFQKQNNSEKKQTPGNLNKTPFSKSESPTSNQ